LALSIIRSFETDSGSDPGRAARRLWLLMPLLNESEFEVPQLILTLIVAVDLHGCRRLHERVFDVQREIVEIQRMGCETEVFTQEGMVKLRQLYEKRTD
jgi:hypothetical protein